MTVRNRHFIFPGLAGAVLAVVAGCTADVPEGAAPGVRVRDQRAPQAGIRYNSVVILDKSLQNWDGQEKYKHSRLAVESTNSRRTPTGTLEAWAILRNRTDQSIQVEGRSQFFDNDKVPTEKPSAWQRVHLPPRGVATYREFSTQTDRVHYYYIELREGR